MNKTSAALFFALSACQALAAPPATMVPDDAVKCDVRLNVTDPDPKGLNVRASPKVAPDNVIGVLKPIGEWTTVHIAANSGDWFLIDGAEMVDDNAPNGMRASFKGRGWVHRSKVGGIEIEPREVLAAPEDGAQSLLRGGDTALTANLKVTACKGKFIQLKGGNTTGWSTRYCTNQRTTCV